MHIAVDTYSSSYNKVVTLSENALLNVEQSKGDVEQAAIRLAATSKSYTFQSPNEKGENADQNPDHYLEFVMKLLILLGVESVQAQLERFKMSNSIQTNTIQLMILQNP